MTLEHLLDALNAGETIRGNSPLLAVMHEISQQALRITGELNSGPLEPAEIRSLLSRLTGTSIDDSVTVFPPFRADFGRNITIGKRVFINSGCTFQDQGGITIGDDCLIGHNAVLATLNHDLAPSRRADLLPAPITLGNNVWTGSNATILPGVTIGSNAVVAAASVVTRDVPENAIVVGSPAVVVRLVTD